MVSAGFLDDLNGFMQRGQIGAIAYLEVDALHPEIGRDCPLTVHTGGAAAEVLIVGHGARMRVRDGTVIAIHVDQDRPLTIVLFDEEGIEVDTITLTPAVDVPTLQALHLPESITYATPTLAAQLQAGNAANVELSYQLVQPGAQWQPLHVGQDGRFVVPLAAQVHVLNVRITLASRHAAWSRRARCVIERQVRVTHPQPQVAFAQHGPVHRFDQLELPLSVRWARACVLSYGDQVMVMVLGPDGQMRQHLHLDTAEVGEQCIRLYIENLDGEQSSRVLTLAVLPRPLSIALVRRDGELEIHIAGASQARLSIPARSVALQLPPEGAVISYRFLLAEPAQLAVIDDCGDQFEQLFDLDPLEHAWKSLPNFSQQNGWRI